MARLIAGCCLALSLLAPAATASAQEQVFVTFTASKTSHLWSGEAATITGRATLADGQLAAGRLLTVETRGYPYTGPYTPEPTRVLVGADGRFTYTARPLRNEQVRFVSDAGQASTPVSVSVFHLALEGDLDRLSGGRWRATELSAVPPGYKIARVYLYFCKPKAKRCSYIARGRATVAGQEMRAKATFTPPTRYRSKKYTVVFRYVPRAGWGDSNAAERRRPRKTIAAGDQAS